MRYVEFAPSAALRRFVKCFWICDDAAPSAGRDAEVITPDGYPEIVLHFRQPPAARTGAGIVETQSRGVIAGQLTRPLILEPGATVGFLGIRFEPATASSLLGVPAAELTDRCAPLESVWGAAGRRLIESIAEATTDRQRVAACERALLDRAERMRDGRPDGVVEAAVHRISQCAGNISVDELVDVTGVGARQLERKFRADVGVSPKLFSRIVRFREIFRALEESPADWAGIAQCCGFFDQSHLIRDFRQFAGQSPRRFLERQSHLSQQIRESLA